MNVETVMKVGDIVMFVDKGIYAKWFFGQLAVVERYTKKGSDGKSHVAVRWLQPVKYHDGYTGGSNFSADKFEKFDENR